MTKYKKTSFEAQAAQQIKDEAHRIATGIKTAGQSREQTKLIAKGIEKGIALYKKQEGVKARSRNKRQRNSKTASTTSANAQAKPDSDTQHPPVQTNARQTASALITAGVIFLLAGTTLAGCLLADIVIDVGDYAIPSLWSLPTALICFALATWMFTAARMSFRSG